MSSYDTDHNWQRVGEHTTALNLAVEEICTHMSSLSAHLRQLPPRSVDRIRCIATISHIGRLLSFLHTMERSVVMIGLNPGGDAPEATQELVCWDTTFPYQEHAEAIESLTMLLDDAKDALVEARALRDSPGDLRSAFEAVRPRCIGTDGIGYPVLAEDFLWRSAQGEIASEVWIEINPDCARLKAEIDATYREMRGVFAELEARALAEQAQRGGLPESHG